MMKTRFTRAYLELAIACLLCASLLLGCAGTTGDYDARFLRYAKLKDGTRVAVVVPVGQGTEEQTAYTDLEDLKPGEVVVVRGIGRGWETPQWRPEHEIVSRAERP